ncbi:hypothetical protein L1987_54692 [Smallanthus sonchifolius]|uniref:Uncharacterized protein n=1 Tax=Smallanthus sonchifolius TaxID=185202 RepID=A0ACB9E888_9ASTR|nr:hypothetical protein L1987_54692 [Smallanthus sonchifolius]
MGNADPPARRTVHQRASDGVTGPRSPITRPAIPNANSWQIPSHVMSTITHATHFHGLEDEDAPGHLSRFVRICDTFNITGVSEDDIYLGLFPFSLSGRASAWLDNLPDNSITTWKDLQAKFYKKYYPPSNAARLRDQIHSFRMDPDRGCCPRLHGQRDQGAEASMLSGVNCAGEATTLVISRSIIQSRSGNNPPGFNGRQQYQQNGRGEIGPTTGSSVDTTLIKEMLETQTQLLAHLVQQDRDARQRLDSHDTLLKNQQSAFHDMQRMVEDMAKSLKDRQGGPSSTSNTSLMAMSVRSVEKKEVVEDDSHSILCNIPSPEEVKKIDWRARFAEIYAKMAEEHVDKEKVAEVPAKEAEEKKKRAETHTPEIDPTCVPYPARLLPFKQAREHSHFLDWIKQLKVNLPLIETLRRMPKYGKFLKDLLSNKKKLEEVSKVSLSEQCSAVVQNKLPEKLEDSGRFTIPCLLGSLPLHHVLDDLGASINLMPFLV